MSVFCIIVFSTLGFSYIGKSTFDLYGKQTASIPYSLKRVVWKASQRTSCQIRKFASCAWARNAGNVFPSTVGSDPDMHTGTCVTHVPGCKSGSLTSGLLWSRWWGKRSRYSRCMRNPQFYVSDKRHITEWHRQFWYMNLILTRHSLTKKFA